ncbi:hypothetical protein N2152v2_004579 [Parachlorella kessleri]
MLADVIVVLASTAEGLQHFLTELEAACQRWGLIISQSKTELMLVGVAAATTCEGCGAMQPERSMLICDTCELETLSHAFALCPAVAPAAEWVGRVFAAVAACPAPPPAATAEVLLVGNGGGWVAPAEAHQVWLLLRGSFLHAVWQLRCRCSLTGWGAQRLALGGGCCFMDGPTAVRPGTLLEAWERRRA